MIFSAVSYSGENHSDTLSEADKLRTSNPKQSQLILSKVDKSLLNSRDIALYQYLIGHNLLLNGKPEQAIPVLQKLAFDNSEELIKFRALSTLLNAYSSVNDWSKALEVSSLLQLHIDSYQELHPEINEKVRIGLLHFYNKVGEHELTKKLASNLLSKALSLRTRCYIKTELLYSFIKTTPRDLKSQDFDETIESCMSIDDPILISVVQGHYAEYLLSDARPDQALRILKKSLPSVKTINYQALTAGFYDLIAQSYLAIENYNEAEKYARTILDTAEQHNYQPSIITAYNVLTAVSEKKGAYKDAIYYFKKYTQANSSKQNENNGKLLAIQKAKFDEAEKNTRISLLDKENALLKTQALLDSESAQNRRLALALLSMVLVVFVLWTYKNRRNYLKMQHYAQIDELTGIANRRHFTQQASHSIKYCQSTNQPVSLILFDLDLFKRINDTYGHQKGDLALKIAVEAAKSACRKNDIIGRLGGEEFGILLPGCASHLAAFIAEKCRKAIRQADFSSCSESLIVTASFGIADSVTCDYSFEKLFACADSALYQSKDMGRNRVVQFQHEMLNTELIIRPTTNS